MLDLRDPNACSLIEFGRDGGRFRHARNELAPTTSIGGADLEIGIVWRRSDPTNAVDAQDAQDQSQVSSSNFTRKLLQVAQQPLVDAKTKHKLSNQSIARALHGTLLHGFVCKMECQRQQ